MGNSPISNYIMKYISIISIITITSNAFINFPRATNLLNKNFKIMMRNDPSMVCSLIIFGGNGHLSLSKLIPSISCIFEEANDQIDINVICCGRKTISQSKFTDMIKGSLNSNNNQVSSDFIDRCIYFQLPNYSDYISLNELNENILHQIEDSYEYVKRIFYFSLPPSETFSILSNFQLNPLFKSIHSITHHKSIQLDYLIEKPIGRDMETCELLLDLLFSNNIKLSNIKLIDHYLGDICYFY